MVFHPTVLKQSAIKIRQALTQNSLTLGALNGKRSPQPVCCVRATEVPHRFWRRAEPSTVQLSTLEGAWRRQKGLQ